MQIDFNDDEKEVRTIRIVGRLDIAGADAIATRFTALSATVARPVIVDLREVSFLASIGIRAIIGNAKALQQRGGKMVLLVSPGGTVEETLKGTGVDMLMPIVTDEAAAGPALQA